MKKNIASFRWLAWVAALLLLSPSHLCRAADVTSYTVTKRQDFLQTGTGTPVLQTGNPFRFNSSVNTPIATNTLISATVQIPGGASRTLTNTYNDGKDFAEYFASQAAMDAVYSNGNYTLSINTTHDGSRAGLVASLSGNLYPNTPHASNLTAAQTINPATNFTLTWDAFTGGTTNDLIAVKIKDANSSTVFRTPLPGSGVVSNGTIAAVVIPAGALMAGQSYSATLQFAKVVTQDTNSYPGALGLSAYISATTFTITAATPAATTSTPGVFPIATNAKLRDHGFPSVAFDGTNYLVGLQLPNSGDSQSQVAAQLVSRSGALVGAQILVSTNGSQTIVAFDGTNYLVSWSDDIRIYGQLISKAGVPVGASFQISQINSPIGNSEGSAVAFDGANYLVLKKEDTQPVTRTGPVNVYGQLVAPSGNLVGTEFQINVTSAGPPAVTFGGTNYLVVWSDDIAGGISGRFVSRSGTPLGSPFVIDGSTNEGGRRVLFDGTKYVVAFHDEVGGANSGLWNVVARFVTTSGTVSTNRVIIASSSGATPYPAVAFDGSNYLFTWTDGLGSTNVNLKGRFMDASGNPVSSEFIVIGPQGTKVPLLAHILFDGRQYFAVSDLRDSTSDLYGTFISPLPRGAFPIAITSSNEAGGGWAYDGTNYLVGISGLFAGQEEVTAQLVSGTGALIGSRIHTGRFGGPNRVAFDGTNYLMVWEDTANFPNNDIYGQRISRAGGLVGTPFAVSSASGRQTFDSINHVVFDGSNYLIVWRDERNGHLEGDIYGQLVTPSGTKLGSEIPIAADTGYQTEPSIGFDGTNYLAVWQNRRVSGAELYDTYAKFISKAGVPGSAFLISQNPSPSHNPTSVAFDGINYLVVWNRNIGPGFPSDPVDDIYARLVTRSGTFVSNEFPITTAPGSQPFYGGVIYDGTAFLASWIDSPTSSLKHRFFSRVGSPLGSEFSLFGSQGTRIPLGGLGFDGSRLFALVSFVDSSFSNGDVYGLFLPQTRLDFAAPVASGQVPLRFTGMPGVGYAIQATADLLTANTIWTTLATSNTLAGTFNFTDTNAASFSRRFYRAVLP